MITKGSAITHEQGFRSPASETRIFGSTYYHIKTGKTYIQKAIPQGNEWVEEIIGDAADIDAGLIPQSLTQTLAVDNITGGYNIVLSDGEGYSDRIGSASTNKYGYRALIALELNDDWVISYNQARYDEDDSGLYIGDGYAAIYSSNENGFGYDAAFELYEGSPTMYATNSDFYSWMGTLDDLASYGDSWQVNNYAISFTQSQHFGAINTKNYGAEGTAAGFGPQAYGVSAVASAQGYAVVYRDANIPSEGEGHYNGVSLVSARNTNLGYSTHFADAGNARLPQFVSVIASDEINAKGATAGTHTNDSINFSLVAASLSCELESTRKSTIIGSDGVTLTDTDYVSVVAAQNFDSSVAINGDGPVKPFSLVSDHIVTKEINLEFKSAAETDHLEGDLFFIDNGVNTLQLMVWKNGAAEQLVGIAY